MTSASLNSPGCPFREQRANNHRLHDPHDLVAIGVVRAELRTLVRIEPPLEERAEDRRIDLRPIQRCRLERGADLRPVQRQRVVVIEQTRR